MPNLWGACSVGRDGRGHSYGAWTVGKGRPSRRRCGRGGVLGVMMVETEGQDSQTRHAANDQIEWSMCLQPEGRAERPEGRAGVHQSVGSARGVRGLR